MSKSAKLLPHHCSVRLLAIDLPPAKAHIELNY